MRPAHHSSGRAWSCPPKRNHRRSRRRLLAVLVPVLGACGGGDGPAGHSSTAGDIAVVADKTATGLSGSAGAGRAGTAYGITGTIGGAFRGASVVLSGPVSAVAPVDANGRFRFSQLPRGDYSLQPRCTACSFSPVSATASLGAVAAQVVNFTAQSGRPALLSLSGTVDSLDGVRLSLAGGATGTTLSSGGRFQFIGLPGGTAYTVTPSHPGYDFQPRQQVLQVSSGQAVLANFQALARPGVVPTVPDPPSAVSFEPGQPFGSTASIGFAPPLRNGGSPVTDYEVTVSPGGQVVRGQESPITISGLTPGVDYRFLVSAINAMGPGAAATTGNLQAYDVVATFHEPVTQPNNTIFSGRLQFDRLSRTVVGLAGQLTQSMTGGSASIGGGGAYGSVPMTTVALGHLLSSIADPALGGLLVTSFALPTRNTFAIFSPQDDGWSPNTGFALYHGFPVATNPARGGVGNAYVRLFINTNDPAAPITPAQLNKLAYADCTAGGMMGSTCMTGTTVAGYGVVGTMQGQPVAQRILPMP